MSDQRDKAIRFTFAVDQRSLEVAKSAIRQLTAEVKQLVETMSRAGSGMQGGGGFGNIFGGFSSKTGGISAARESTLKGTNPLTQGVAADARALSSVAKAGTDALRNLSTASRQTIGEQISNIERLRKSVLDLERAYDSLGNVQAKPGSRAAGNLDSVRLEHEVALGAARQQLASAQAGFSPAGGGGGFVGHGQRVVNRGGVDYVEDMPGEARRSLWQRMNSPLWGDGKGGGQQRSGLFGRMAPLTSALGIPSWAGPAGAVVGGYEMGTRMYLGNQQFHAQENYQALGDSLRRRAAISQAYGGVGAAVRSDVNTSFAVSQLTPNDIRSALGPEYTQAKIREIQAQAGETPELKNMAKDLFSGTVGWSSGITSSAKQAMMERMLGDINASQGQRLSEMVTQKIQSQNVIEGQYRSEFNSEYLSRMALMRQSGLGGEYHRVMGGPGGGGPTGSAPFMMEGNKAQLLGVGTPYTSGEVAGAMAQLGTSAGRRFMSEGLGVSMLRYQYGGLGNATQLYGAAAGYGNPGRFMGALSGASGRGAGMVDTTATGQIGDLYSGAMMGGDFYGSGAAGAGGMLSTAALFGGDLRSARGAGGGYAANAAYSGGQTDRLQQAINVLSSVRQGGTLYSQEALRNMSPALRMEIMRKVNTGELTNANLPTELKQQGVTTEMLAGYGAERNKLMFAEYMSAQGSPGVNAAVGAWRQNGVGSLRGLEGGALRDQITTLGIAAMQSGRAPTVEAGKHLVAQIAAEDPSIFAAMTRGGIGDPGANSFEALQKNQRDQLILDKEGYTVGAKGKGDIATANSPEMLRFGASLAALGTTIGVEGSRVGKELALLADQIAEVRRDIRENRPSSRARSAAPHGKE